MKKFFVLLKKELRELLTPQMLLPLLLTVVLFVMVGKMVGSQVKKMQVPQQLAVVDLDKTTISANLQPILGQIFKVEMIDQPVSDALNTAKEKGIKTMMVIPKDFEKNVEAANPQQVEVYTVINNFSLTGIGKAELQKMAVSSVNEYVSNLILSARISNLDPKVAKNPVGTKNFVLIGSKMAEVDPSQVINFVTQQSIFIPIILFLVIIMASQLVAVAMATEKENKTLETLLSAPVSRNYIIAAKLVGAGIASLLMAAVYMFGFRYYLTGITGAALSSTAATSSLSQLGLILSSVDFALLGVSLFFGILAALSLAIILAAFVEDVKNVQAVITPLMIMVAVPYFLVLFLDFSALSPAVRWLVYFIPFSHPFLASQNIFLHNYLPVIYGIVYEFIFFVVFVIIAAKIFSSDKILTMRFSLKKKK
jgi:ABC-2 type transport system permease protein